MIIQPPQTVKDFIEIKETILSLMQNKFADKVMIEKLKIKLANTEKQINSLQN